MNGQAELTLQESGFEALSVRAVAAAVSATTRSVYGVFGSKDGLLAAVAVRAFALLGAAVAALPTTDEPGRDLVEAGAVVLGQRQLVEVTVIGIEHR